MAVGVLGGTFDPVHKGHLIIAREATLELGLETAYFIPAGNPPLKDHEVTPAHHRLQMLRLALAGDKGFLLSTMELERPGLSYTVDTLRELRRTDPRELYLILGRDTVAGLSRWHRPQELISLCYIATVPRPGVPELDVAALEVTLPGLREKLRLLSGPNIGISASEIRQRVVRGLPVHNLLPTGVEEYIREHGLYREG